MDDLISRQAAIDVIEDFPHGCVWNIESMEEMADRIKTLPSAEPENCEVCKHRWMWENEVEYGFNSPCTGCKRRAMDNYER